MNIKLINKSSHAAPEYKTQGSSGMDIRANLKSPVLLHPQEHALIPTGLFLEMPNNLEAQIRPRSGLALKKGVTVLNTPGTIDSDYRGEIGVILINHSKNICKIEDGDRIAQLVVMAVQKTNWSEQDSLTKTERGSGGFGSTGTN